MLQEYESDFTSDEIKYHCGSRPVLLHKWFAEKGTLHGSVYGVSQQKEGQIWRIRGHSPNVLYPGSTMLITGCCVQLCEPQTLEDRELFL